MKRLIEQLERAACSLEERMTLKPLASELLQLCRQVRRDGILSLDNYSETLPSGVLKQTLQNVADMVDPETLQDIGLASLYSSNVSPKELLAGLLVLCAALSYSDYESPRILSQKLGALLGYSLDEADSENTTVQLDQEEQISNPTIQPVPWQNVEISHIEYLKGLELDIFLNNLNRESLQILLARLPPGLYNHVIHQLSARLVQDLNEEVSSMPWLKDAKYDHFWQDILLKLRKLVEIGTVVIRVPE